MLWNYAGVMIRGLATFLLGIPLARMLGPGPYGLIAIAWLVITFTNLLAEAGFGSALIHSDALSEEDVRFVFTLQLMLGLFLTGTMFFASGVISEFFHVEGARPILQVMCLSVLLTAVLQVPSSILRRNLDFKRIQIAGAATYVGSYLLVGIPMAWRGFGVWALVASALIQNATYLGLLYAMVRHSLRPRFHPGTNGIRKFGVKVLMNNFCIWIVGNIDNLLVGRLLGAWSLGLYSRSFSFVNAPVIMTAGNLQTVLFPSYARFKLQRDLQQKVYLASLEGIAYLVLPVFLAIAFCARTVMLGVFGTHWAEATPILVPLASAMPLLALSGLATPLLLGIGRVEIDLRTQLVTAVLSIPLLILAAQHSIQAFSWAVFGLYLLRFSAIVLQLKALLGFRMKEFSRSLMGPCLLAIATIAGATSVDHLSWVSGFGVSARFLSWALGGLLAAGLTIWMGVRQLPSNNFLWLLNRLSPHMPRYIKTWLTVIS